MHHSQPKHSEPDDLTIENDETTAVVVFSWKVPKVAKVPAPSQGDTPNSAIFLRPAIISSTVPVGGTTELRANNTAMATTWCTTATLTVTVLAGC